MEQRIRAVLEQYGRLPNPVAGIDANDDLYRGGLTSHASVNVMLGLEDEFDVEFPDSMLRKSTFESIAAIEAALRELSGAAQLPA